MSRWANARADIAGLVLVGSHARGVGRALMGEIERRASGQQLSRLETHASVTARPCFEAFGFSVTRVQVLELRGESLKNFVMHRNMAGPSTTSGDAA